MEYVATRMCACRWRKSPDHLAVFALVLVGAEGALREHGEAKVPGPDEGAGCAPGRPDLVHAVGAHPAPIDRPPGGLPGSGARPLARRRAQLPAAAAPGPCAPGNRSPGQRRLLRHLRWPGQRFVVGTSADLDIAER